MSYRIELDYRALSGLDFSCSYKDRAFTAFNEYIESIGLKDKHYKNKIRKIWLSKTDYKYVKPFLNSLSVESIPFNIIKLK
jgi:hypothetical protein